VICDWETALVLTPAAEAAGFRTWKPIVWDKVKIGMGYHARNQHELLLVAKRGEIPPPPIEARASSVIHAARGEHSEKPVEFYELIERMYPTLPRIELFARAARDGWGSWGNQAPGAAA
jgi:N6-adenosine-specific RNA methylase IME4